MTELMGGRDLYEMISTEVDLARKYSPRTTSRVNLIAGLKMMINYPDTYQHTDRINPKNLREMLDIVYVCWLINFKRVCTFHEKLLS